MPYAFNHPRSNLPGCAALWKRRLRRATPGFWLAAALLGQCTCAAGQQPADAPCPDLKASQGLMAQGRWNDATRSLRENLAGHALCAEAHSLLAYALLRNKEAVASLKEYTTAAQLRPPSSDDFTAVASDYILLKAYTDAERWLIRATQVAPVNPQAWYLLGRTQYNLDHNEDAVASFQHSLEREPRDARSEYNLGLAYERLQQPELARAAYDTAIAWQEASGVRDAQPYLDLGVLDRTQGHPQEALSHLNKAAELSPANPLVFQELGRTLMELGRVEEAVVALKTAIALAPAAEAPHYFLGRAYRAAGKTAEAAEEFALVQRLANNQSTTATPNTDHAQ